MKITNLKLIEETDKFVTFEVYFKSFFGEKKRLGMKNKKYDYCEWMDTGENIFLTNTINAWLETGKKEFKIY